MPRKVAFIFPGQGSQYVGMGKEMAARFPAAAAVYEEADNLLGLSISELCFNGPEERLQLTENTQPAILTTSTAAYRVLEERGVKPDFVAGHSLGEYSGLVATGTMLFSEAVSLVRRRGQYMQEAVAVGEGAMAAILGLEAKVVEDVCLRVAEGEVVSAANFNSSKQVVISGHFAAVNRAVALAKESGARRAILLPVSAPFHCEMMVPAEKRLEADLDAILFGNLQFPLISNVEAKAILEGDQARTALKLQVSRPVHWYGTIRLLLDAGVDTFVEVGPAKVLTGLVRSIEKSVTMLNVEDESSLDKTLAAFL